MCRLFAYISPSEPCLIEDVIITPEHSLCKQVNEGYLPGLIASHNETAAAEKEAIARNRFLNIDGFGVGYFNTTRANFTPCEGAWPVTYRCAQPPLRDPNFRSLAANTSTLTLFAHIRSSSGAPVVTVNNHPFVFGRQMIMHNGYISDFQQIKMKLCEKLNSEAYAAIDGGTDSEHFAALYVTYLGQAAGVGKEGMAKAWERSYTAPEMKSALIRALETLFEIQIAVLGENAPGNDLNFCVTDGQSMVAMRVRNHKQEEPPSLYYSTKAGVSLNSKYPGTADGEDNEWWSSEPEWTKEPKEHGLHVICASEPSTKVAAQWELIPKNHCILVEPSGRLRVEEITFKESLNARKVTVTIDDFCSHLQGPHDKYGNRVDA